MRYFCIAPCVVPATIIVGNEEVLQHLFDFRDVVAHTYLPCNFRCASDKDTILQVIHIKQAAIGQIL